MAKVSSTMVLDALEESTLFKSGPHVMLREVRNGTGVKRIERYADALVVSLWPSRGIWFAGVEVKVARSDWLSELKNPRKSAEIQRWCDYWWLVTSEGVVKPEEVPQQWGWATVDEKKRVTVQKSAPRLEPEQLTRDFVASVLRNAGQVSAAERDAIRNQIRSEVEGDVEEQFTASSKALAYDRLTEGVEAFCKASGLRELSAREIKLDGESLGKTWDLATRLAGNRHFFVGTQSKLRLLADAMDQADEALRAAHASRARAVDNAKKFVEQLQAGPPADGRPEEGAAG